MAEIQELLGQLEQAKGQLLHELRVIDGQYSALRGKRNQVTSGAVSHVEYVDLLRESFLRRGAQHGRDITRMIAEKGVAYGWLTATMAANPTTGLGGTWLTGDSRAPTHLTESAMYFYFGDLMAERVGAVVAHLPWDDKAMPAEQRETVLVEIDAALAQLQSQRNDLAAQLEAAGLKG